MQFLSYLINGISLGSVYALIALGYTMVYGIAKMLNFAHGDVIMIGSYVVFFAFGSAAFLNLFVSSTKTLPYSSSVYWLNSFSIFSRSIPDKTSSLATFLSFVMSHSFT